ncbi:MAG TPA: DUF4160 domain-containing protein [Paludibacter sp.]|nr:DUF4160 domain-containing protein [Paludibacter sp.]
MPKVLVYITAKITWIFLFWGTDFHENRAHVHVGKRGTEELCKIWLEPVVSIEFGGSLTENHQNQVLQLAIKYQKEMLKQWEIFKSGKKVKMITIKK